MDDLGDDTGHDREQGPPDLVRAGVIFYGVMLAVGLIWRMGFYGENVIYASAADEAAGVRWGRDLALGLGVGAAAIAGSEAMTRLSGWGDRLARALGAAIGPIAARDALLLAMASGLAEEVFFRGALQPRVGWLVASVIFGGVHFIPRRELLPWTGFALAMGLVLGALFEWTGNLIAPVVAHSVINGINLPLLARRHGHRTPDR